MAAISFGVSQPFFFTIPHARKIMPAYIIGHITIKDAAKWADYCSKVPTTMAAWAANSYFAARRRACCSGAHPHADTVVARFPDAAALAAWHDGAAYQALIPLRTAAADVVLISYDA